MPKILSSELPYLVGYYGYITMPGFVIGILFRDFIKYGNNFPALVVFPGFLVFNQGINGLLKQICRQSRPDNQINIVENDSKTNNKMGMPSGHAQSVTFALTYLLYSQNNAYLNSIGIITSGLTIAQRLIYRKHTPLQVLVGSTLGTIIGYGAFKVSKLISVKPTVLTIITAVALVPLSFYVDHYNIVERHFISLLKRDD